MQLLCWHRAKSTNAKQPFIITLIRRIVSRSCSRPELDTQKVALHCQGQKIGAGQCQSSSSDAPSTPPLLLAGASHRSFLLCLSHLSYYFKLYDVNQSYTTCFTRGPLGHEWFGELPQNVFKTWYWYICDREDSIMTRPNKGCCAIGKKYMY